MAKSDENPASIWLTCRRLLRLDQTAVGQSVGTSRQAVGALETGKRQPKAKELLAYASLYRVRPEVLMAGDVAALMQGRSQSEGFI